MILDENERPMIAVHECWSDDEANIIVSVLRDGGIDAIVNSEVPHNVLPIKTAGLGKVNVLVREVEIEQARKIIADHIESAKEGDAP